MANKVILMGNMTNDVELTYTSSGMAIGSFSIAINRRQKDSATGDYVEKTTFVPIKAFGKTAEIISQYLGKGSKIYIEGRLEMDHWTTPDGMNRSKMYVILDNFEFASPKKSGDSNSYSSYKPAVEKPMHKNDMSGVKIIEEKIPEVNLDEEIPF
jgi:single-strand DNA-binding protein